MFVALARAVLRHRTAVWVGTVLVLALAVASAIRGGSLTTGTIEGTESTRAAELARGALGADTDGTVVALLSHPPMKATDPVFQAALEQVLAAGGGAAQRGGRGLGAERSGARPARASSPPTASEALVLVRLARRGEGGGAGLSARSASSSATVRSRSPSPASRPSSPTSTTSWRRICCTAELISFPLALLVLLWVFRTVVASLLPRRGRVGWRCWPGWPRCSPSPTRWTWPSTRSTW